MRLIDADSINWENVEEEYGARTPAVVACQSLIQNAPTIDPIRHGEWIYIRDEEGENALYECSVCHKGDIHVPMVKVSYCWNCGAKMDGEENE